MPKRPEFLHDGLKGHDVPLINFSTDYVYDGHGAMRWHEDDEPQPLSIYGSTKLAGDNEVRATAVVFSSVRISGYIRRA